MNIIKEFNPKNKPSQEEKQNIINFLHENLQEFRDSKEAIEKAIDFALKNYTSFGGFVLVSSIEDQMTGVVIVNITGMKDYIPENILVYIATHKDFRGKGIGKELMKETIERTEGNIALHVEPENPARFLYEKVGFTSKYLEMRLQK